MTQQSLVLRSRKPLACIGEAAVEKSTSTALMEKCSDVIVDVLCLLLTKNGLDTLTIQLLEVRMTPIARKCWAACCIKW